MYMYLVSMQSRATIGPTPIVMRFACGMIVANFQITLAFDSARHYTSAKITFSQASRYSCVTDSFFSYYQPKHILWVLKRIRRFFYEPETYVTIAG